MPATGVLPSKTSLRESRASVPSVRWHLIQGSVSREKEAGSVMVLLVRGAMLEM
jgi:hypothetical protein